VTHDDTSYYVKFSHQDVLGERLLKLKVRLPTTATGYKEKEDTKPDRSPAKPSLG